VDAGPKRGAPPLPDGSRWPEAAMAAAAIASLAAGTASLAATVSVPIALPSGQDVQDVIDRVQDQQITFDYDQKIDALKAELAMKKLEQDKLEKEIAKAKGQTSQQTGERRLELTRDISSLNARIETQQKNQKNGLLDIKLLNEFLNMRNLPSEQTANAARFENLTTFFWLMQKVSLSTSERVTIPKLRNILEPQIPTAAAQPDLFSQLKARTLLLRLRQK
jgi:septal ring factor EnvC (AmiA/AmiB activator)